MDSKILISGLVRSRFELSGLHGQDLRGSDLRGLDFDVDQVFLMFDLGKISRTAQRGRD